MKNLTVSDIKKYIINELKDISDSAVFEANEILIFALGINRNQLVFYNQKSITSLQARKIKRIVGSRKKGLPLQYLFGEWEFYSIKFKVGKGVLIPRADTEILVDAALEYLSETDRSKTVFDLCSGSGAVGIAIAANRPEDEITLVEKSKKAFKYLKYNNEINKVGCKMILADVFSWNPDEKCDLLVCNPPYIPTGDITGLSKEVRNEPKMALDGGKDGLEFYRSITSLAEKYINHGGRIMYEIGYNEAEEVTEILSSRGFSDIKILKDYGGNDRVVAGTFKS